MSRHADSSCALVEASLYALLARPDDFHGQRVRLTGFLHVEFESQGIYPHREDAERGLLVNGLWINATVPDSLNDGYVLVEGRFDAESRGHFGLWSGSLVDVTRLESHRWPFRNPPAESIPQIDLRIRRQ